MPIKRPPPDIPGYMELRKQFGGAAAPSPKIAEAPRTAPPADMQKLQPTPPARLRTRVPKAVGPALKTVPAAEAANSVMVKGSAAVPEPGYDPVFDAAAETYGALDAVRMLVDRGAPGFLEAVRTGQVSGLAPAYPRRSRSVQLARTLPADMVETLTAWADPLGILKPSKTAGIILTQILAWQLTLNRG